MGAVDNYTHIAQHESMKRKLPAAVQLGRRGGKARAKALTAERQSEIGKIANAARNLALTPEERKRIAKLAIKARWNR
jgi:DNA-binding protein H-NS